MLAAAFDAYEGAGASTLRKEEAPPTDVPPNTPWVTQAPRQSFPSVSSIAANWPQSTSQMGSSSATRGAEWPPAEGGREGEGGKKRTSISGRLSGSPALSPAARKSGGSWLQSPTKGSPARPASPQLFRRSSSPQLRSPVTPARGTSAQRSRPQSPSQQRPGSANSARGRGGSYEEKNGLYTPRPGSANLERLDYMYRGLDSTGRSHSNHRQVQENFSSVPLVIAKSEQLAKSVYERNMLEAGASPGPHSRQELLSTLGRRGRSPSRGKSPSPRSPDETYAPYINPKSRQLAAQVYSRDNTPRSGSQENTQPMDGLPRQTSARLDFMWRQGSQALREAEVRERNTLSRREAEELKECTFEPELSTRGQHVSHRHLDYAQSSAPFLEREQAWRERRAMWLQQERAQKKEAFDEEEMRACTFRPDIRSSLASFEGAQRCGRRSPSPGPRPKDKEALDNLEPALRVRLEGALDRQQSNLEASREAYYKRLDKTRQQKATGLQELNKHDGSAWQHTRTEPRGPNLNQRTTSIPSLESPVGCVPGDLEAGLRVLQEELARLSKPKKAQESTSAEGEKHSLGEGVFGETVGLEEGMFHGVAQAGGREGIVLSDDQSIEEEVENSGVRSMEK